VLPRSEKPAEERATFYKRFEKNLGSENANFKSKFDPVKRSINKESANKSVNIYFFDMPMEEQDLVEVTIRSTRNSEHARTFVERWKRLPDAIHENAEVHYDGGRGVEGSVRIKKKGGRAWVYLKGSLKGAPGKPKRRYVRLSNESYPVYQLVLIAYVGHHPDDGQRWEACHIERRENDSDPWDGISNLYWGTRNDNILDRLPSKERHGKRRKLRGRSKQHGSEEWTYFSSQQDAATAIGVTQSAITYALKNGQNVKGWHIELVQMDFEEGEEKVYLEDCYTSHGRKFITNRGRLGETKKFNKDGDDIETDVEIKLEKEDGGYTQLHIRGKGEKLHRLVAKFFLKDVIEAKEKESGVPWYNLQVDHINGDESDNRVENLRIVTREEHAKKHARVVVEIDECGNKLNGKSWNSISEAARETGLDKAHICRVCLGKRKTIGPNKRKFAFEEEFDALEIPKRKFKSTNEI
jgi:hypothetical protein